MNNGKVRIYELSKELNLENKDLLEICGQLNIPVKSHSSTITESQAQRIRQAAKRATPSPTVSKSQARTKESSNGSSGSANRPKGKRKQQILALHKQNRSASSDKSSSTETPVLTAPPRSPDQAQAPSPPQPPASNEPEPAAASLEQSPSLPKTEVTEVTEIVESKTTSTADENLQLLAPPTRQPKIAKPKPVQSPTTEAEPQSQAKEVAAAPSEEKPTSPAVVKKPTEELKEPPKLQKPPRIKPPAEQTKSQEVATSTESETEVQEEVETELLEPPTRPKQKLKRPSSAPRPSKRPTWEEDEEETEVAEKSKTTKSKRRKAVIDDEDEEVFGSSKENDSTPALASLSVARPPKPKHLAQTGTAAESDARKTQKIRPKTEASPARAKVERRNKKEEVQLPDKIVLEGDLTVRELSELLTVSETDIITKLFLKGIAVNITQTLDIDTARLVAEEFEVEVETAEATSAAAKATEMLNAEDLENLQHRPPVVTIMGHVDHGKTTLLDSIRKTKVAQGEAGGITQHIGAYHVDVEHNGQPEQIVFLDTPGHEAFTAMRARGTRVTDIAILVVAADDGIQPQTREAISHARAAEVPIVIAINKIDKPGSEPDRVKQELTELNLVPEDWGGDTITVPVSALKGENLDTLLEMILLVAEIEELSANPNRPAKGTVIEANLDRARGPVATLLVQNGTLRVGDVIAAGSVFGKIRAMINDRGEKVQEASPSFAVEVLGLNDVPAAGDEFDIFTSEKEARSVADQRSGEQRQSRLQQVMASRRVTLSSLSAQAQEGELKELNLILKADVQGSLEAILGSLEQLPQGEVQIRVLLASPGEITETDVDLAAASGAVVVGFNTTLASGARAAADREGVDVRVYEVIYKLFDDIQGAMEGLLEPEEVEQPLGTAEVRAVFPVGRGSVAGCYVQSGKLVRNRHLRVRRNGQVVFEGIMDSLKRVKEDVREVNAGYECGVNSSKFNDWQEGDQIEAYEMVMKRRTLSS